LAKGLGKGLDALFMPTDNDVDQSLVEEVSINDLRPNPYQPRKTFDADAIEELKISILEYGIVQPLIVRKSIKGYEIVAGERRFRAAKEAGLKVVPAIVKELDDEKMMEIALLENLQREDLSIIEEALAYKNLIEQLNLTQEELSKKLGKSRSHIANTIRLLSLPEEVTHLINSNELSMGHARALLGLKNKDNTISVANKIVTEKLNVRQVEQLITKLNEAKPSKQQKQKEKDPFYKAQEDVLREKLGTKVSISKGVRKGKIEIEFYNNSELEQLLSILNK